MQFASLLLIFFGSLIGLKISELVGNKHESYFLGPDAFPGIHYIKIT